MSQTWNQGYFTDAAYTHGYYPDLNPVLQRFTLELQGWALPAAQQPASARHCELGFGQGISLAIHAAANPGHYTATDFNPAHAQHAQALAHASGSGAQVLDDSFEQLLARPELAPFDSLSLHGIWSWVSPANRDAITELARRQLKPGGVLYISYNCLPGWAPASPLRQLFALHDHYASVSGPSVEQRVDAAVQFAQQLLGAQPAYLRSVPQLSARLDEIAKQNKNYLAHEYFNRQWNCLYFHEVVDALAGAKLDWACSATLLDGLDAINLKPEAQSFLKGVQHPILREQARDYFVNRQFRKDLFVRGAVRLRVGEHRERLLSTRLVLTRAAADISMKVTGALGEGSLSEQAYRPFIAALAEDGQSPKTLRQLIPRLGEAVSWAQVQQVLLVLSGMGVVAPCHSEEVERSVRTRCRQLNRQLCERARYGSEITSLASPLTGGGVSVGRFHQLFLLARELGKKQPQEWAQFAWQQLAVQNERLLKEGQALQTPQENLEELTRLAQAFAQQHLPVFKVLQVA
ncbi:methyltransferase [Melaminivora suipulveris]|uniref:Methyltransferase n=1 Tax=Melaminivora suipulveris TaxID=2109913 RepID=A0A2R3QA34_9BURK|nr:class I SAM-dependent methyltransferase [Melaminivora suipulveris]AVO48653.1 methyltransferase [Melaminivora suipulveris]